MAETWNGEICRLFQRMRVVFVTVLHIKRRRLTFGLSDSSSPRLEWPLLTADFPRRFLISRFSCVIATPVSAATKLHIKKLQDSVQKFVPVDLS
jgi:hypothetical protein